MILKLFVIAVMLIAISFYSIGPVLCDELFQNACYEILNTERHYTMLSYFLVVFATGFLVLLKSVGLLRIPQKRTVAIGATTTAVLVLVVILYGIQPFLVEVTDFKKEYRTGEPVTFEVRTAGFGNVCSKPHVQIARADRSWPLDGTNIVWSNNYRTGCIGDPEYKFFNRVWDTNSIAGTDAIHLNETGKFELRVSHGNRHTEVQFLVADR